MANLSVLNGPFLSLVLVFLSYWLNMPESAFLCCTCVNKKVLLLHLLYTLNTFILRVHLYPVYIYSPCSFIHHVHLYTMFIYKPCTFIHREHLYIYKHISTNKFSSLVCLFVFIPKTLSASFKFYNI